MVHISCLQIMLLLVKPTRSFTSKSLVTCCTRIAILSFQENSLQKLFCTINCSCEIDFLTVLLQRNCQRSRPILQLGSLPLKSTIFLIGFISSRFICNYVRLPDGDVKLWSLPVRVNENTKTPTTFLSR
jgi:hypothetical protein